MVIILIIFDAFKEWLCSPTVVINEDPTTKIALNDLINNEFGTHYAIKSASALWSKIAKNTH